MACFRARGVGVSAPPLGARGGSPPTTTPGLSSQRSMNSSSSAMPRATARSTRDSIACRLWQKAPAREACWSQALSPANISRTGTCQTHICRLDLLRRRAGGARRHGCPGPWRSGRLLPPASGLAHGCRPPQTSGNKLGLRQAALPDPGFAGARATGCASVCGRFLLRRALFSDPLRSATLSKVIQADGSDLAMNQRLPSRIWDHRSQLTPWRFCLACCSGHTTAPNHAIQMRCRLGSPNEPAILGTGTPLFAPSPMVRSSPKGTACAYAWHAAARRCSASLDIGRTAKAPRLRFPALRTFVSDVA